MRLGHCSITGLPVYVGLGGGKALDSGDSWRTLVLRAGWRRGGGYELSWCKDYSTALDETRQPFHYRPACLCWLAGWKVLDSWDSWRMLVLRAGWRRGGGYELSWCKDTPPRWMRPGHCSITGLPVSCRAGSPAVAYPFVSFCLAERRSTAVSHLCFPELQPRSRGFCRHRQTG